MAYHVLPPASSVEFPAPVALVPVRLLTRRHHIDLLRVCSAISRP
jgi:hypothetical protein